MKHVFGSNTMSLVVQYLRMNLDAMELGSEVLALPIAPLLLWDGANTKPDPCKMPEAVLTKPEVKRLMAVFTHIDADHNGLLSLDELTAVLGGAAQGFFDLIDLNEDGELDKDEWKAHFLRIKRGSGTSMLTWRIDLFERTMAVQEMIRAVINDAAELHAMITG